ncbi:hypothetical protein ANN_09425 [Periplaneta americana]|uniref:Uncharacterized protein n=1 Tax=Periplaneta americana TaxID=6978 RepID=A0ABQ8TLA9_PERAM|nr:hypothetical protein ANN_09425 [Periplaneta americana]
MPEFCHAEACRTARVNPKPYHVESLEHSFFKKYSSLSYITSILPDTKLGDPVVVDIRCLKYEPDGSIQYKLKFSDNADICQGELRTLQAQTMFSVFGNRSRPTEVGGARENERRSEEGCGRSGLEGTDSLLVLDSSVAVEPASRPEFDLSVTAAVGAGSPEFECSGPQLGDLSSKFSGLSLKVRGSIYCKLE